MNGYGNYYCSVATFLNILDGKQIYLSDPLKMNDTEEMKWFLDLLEKEDISHIQDMVPELLSVKDRVVPQIRRILTEEGQDNIFICCFSLEEDLLSQWRGYGDDGKGVSIGFNLKKIKERNRSTEIKKVMYEKSIRKENLLRALEDMGDMDVYSKYTSGHKDIVDLCSRLMICYKHPSFEEEKEVRLVYSRNYEFIESEGELGIIDKSNDENRLGVNFRLNRAGDDLIEFVKLDIMPDEFEEICLGPKCKLSPHYVQRLVREMLKRDIPVHTSGSTYR